MNASLLRRFLAPVLASLMLTCVTPPARAQVSLNTADQWNGVSSFTFFGNTNTKTFGQKFVPIGNGRLASFTFYVRQLSGAPGTLCFQPYIYAWDGSKITGKPLFTGPIMALAGSGVFEQITVPAGDVPLQPGANYVAFFTTLGAGGAPSGTGSGFGFVSQSVYAPGSIVYQNDSGGGFGGLSTSAWSSFSANLAFDFEFSGADAPDTPGQFYLFTTESPAPTPGEADVTIRRTGGVGAVTVNYATADGAALAGRDYTATSGVAAFAAGQTDQTIRIPLLAAAPNGATLNVLLSNPTGGSLLGNPSSLTVTIANSTPPPPSPYVALADAAYTQAAAYFAAGDQANGYFCYASYEYYLYLLDPSNTTHLNAYYQDMAYAYYLSYTAAGDPAAALAWYNYYVSFI